MNMVNMNANFWARILLVFSCLSVPYPWPRPVGPAAIIPSVALLLPPVLQELLWAVSSLPGSSHSTPLPSTPSTLHPVPASLRQWLIPPPLLPALSQWGRAADCNAGGSRVLPWAPVTLCSEEDDSKLYCLCGCGCSVSVVFRRWQSLKTVTLPM